MCGRDFINKEICLKCEFKFECSSKFAKEIRKEINLMLKNEIEIFIK